MNQNALSTQSEWEDHLSSVLLQDPLKTPWKERPFHACVSEEQARCTVHGCTEPKETDGIDPGVSVCFKTHQHR